MSEELPESVVIWNDAQFFREYPNGLPTDRPVIIMAYRWDIVETLNNYLTALPRNVVAACVVVNPRKHRIAEIKP